MPHSRGTIVKSLLGIFLDFSFCIYIIHIHKHILIFKGITIAIPVSSSVLDPASPPLCAIPLIFSVFYDPCFSVFSHIYRPEEGEREGKLIMGLSVLSLSFPELPGVG